MAGDLRAVLTAFGEVAGRDMAVSGVDRARPVHHARGRQPFALALDRFDVRVFRLQPRLVAARMETAAARQVGSGTDFPVQHDAVAAAVAIHRRRRNCG